jgi:hypothetical protein
MIYEILNSEGQVLNRIVADLDFVVKHYEFYREIPEPEPPPEKIISKLAFRERFTTQEKVAVYTAAETNILIKVWLDDLNSAEYVTLDHPPLVEGVNYLEQEEIISEGRAGEILA